MRVIITGGTGLIGRSLAQLLVPQGYEVIVLSRRPALAAQMFHQQGLMSIQTVGWDARSALGWGELITSESAIVNLAGATPAHWRWTRSYRAHILESRLHAGEAVMQAIERYGPPQVLVQASASGYYGDRGQELLTEACLPGQGFRAMVCQKWEVSTAHAQTRRCLVRTGLVLDTHEGASLHFCTLHNCGGVGWEMDNNGFPGFTKWMLLEPFSSSLNIRRSPAHSICVHPKQ